MSCDYRREYDSTQCPVCFHHQRVRRDGLLAKHRNRLTRQPCQGGGTNPSVARRPLLVNGKPIPKHIADGSPGDFARYCGETDPKVLAFLDADDDDRVFCGNCGRSIFQRSTDNEWAHVSTHDHACPPTVAEPKP